MKFILGLVVSFAAKLLALWRWGKYLEIAYGLYRAVLVILGIWLMLDLLRRGAETLAWKVFGFRQRIRGSVPQVCVSPGR